MTPAIDTAPPPAVVQAVCTISVPREIPTSAPCVVMAVQEGDGAGVGFLIYDTISIQFFGVLEPGNGHMVVSHVSLDLDTAPHPVVQQSGCDVDGVRISCYTPGLMVKAVIQ